MGFRKAWRWKADVHKMMRPQTPWIFRPEIFRNMWWMRQATAPSKNALEVEASHKKIMEKKRPCFILSECKHLICIPVTRFLSAQYLDLKTGESQRSTATHRFPKTWSNHSLFRCDDLGSVENPITKQPQFAFMATVYHGIPLFGMI